MLSQQPKHHPEKEAEALTSPRLSGLRAGRKSASLAGMGPCFASFMQMKPKPLAELNGRELNTERQREEIVSARDRQRLFQMAGVAD